MADELLSQEEIDLLLQTLGRKEEKKTYDVKPLDLSMFEHISAGRLPGLELIFERWISGLRRGMASLVASIPNILKESVSVMRFGDFVKTLPTPCAIGLLSVDPLRGTCLLAVDPKLIYVIVSSVFGGGARSNKVEDRDFTRIEFRIIQRLFNVCYQELEMAWKTMMDVRIQLISMETKPTLLTTARTRERFIILKLNVIIEGNEGYIQLAIPENAVVPYKDLLKGSADLKLKDIHEDAIRALQGIQVNLEVILGSAEIIFEKLLDLKEGDVIALNRLLREPVEVRIEGISKFLAFLGQTGNRKAIKLQRYVDMED
ncbi:MAG: FliM/FliN family flagellar motor switch protein [Aquificaceae bacterium]|nr:FliM/FliN family flagellar motor switch protein [Aquificaceae bacterium]MCS7277433.1 FliM/FliN family flagellar motor switch protein [Aquificaceae bacterium]MDW8423356.1 FliM/FliN family flagellar motor switch protein [Aquificaceae bacterium]